MRLRGCNGVTFTALLVLCLTGALSGSARAQADRTPVMGTCEVTPNTASMPKVPAAPGVVGGVKITADQANEDLKKILGRKRFYLLERSVQSIGLDWTTAPRREEYFKGASTQLLEWLKKYDCDTIYCPQLEAQYADAKNTVPEFQRAFSEGTKDFSQNPKLALDWITVNFPLKKVRSQYFDRKAEWLEAAARRAGKVATVMTNDNGIAFFTEIKPNFANTEPKSYFISNIFPIENGNILWNCEVVVPPLPPAKLQSVTVEFVLPKPGAASPSGK